MIMSWKTRRAPSRPDYRYVDQSYPYGKRPVKVRSAAYQFPGYPTNPRLGQVRIHCDSSSVHPLTRRQIAVKDWRKPPVPITKSKLAYEIARRVGQYLDKFSVSYRTFLVIWFSRAKPDGSDEQVWRTSVENRPGRHEAREDVSG